LRISLHSKGLAGIVALAMPVRKTRQREAIYQALDAAPGPLSLEEILAAGRKAYPALGQRTVYRNINEMIEEGSLIRLEFPGLATRYERPAEAGRHHPHFVCRVCGKVFDLPGETPDIAGQYEAPPGIILDGEEVLFFGQCTDPASCPYRPLEAGGESGEG